MKENLYSMSSKTATGRGPSNKTLSGLSEEITGGSLVGGASGQVPYQTAPNTTAFSNAADGVLQSSLNAITLTSTPTTIKRLTAPTAEDLEFISLTAAKKIKLTTNAGDVNISVDNGATNVLTVKSDATLQTLIPSAAFLKTNISGVIEAGVDGAPAAYIVGGSAGQVPYQSTVNTTVFSNATNGILQNIGNVVDFTPTPTTISTITAPSATDLLLENTTAARPIELKTNAGAINLNTNNGGTDAWTVAATSGAITNALASATLNLTLGSVMNVINGLLRSTILPALIEVTDGTAAVLIFGNAIAANNTNFVLRTTTASSVLSIVSNLGDIILSSNSGGSAHLKIRGTDGALITPLFSAAYLKTDVNGVIGAGTVLPVSAGGTGYSVFKPPTRQRYLFTSSGAIQVFSLDIDCKYFTVELTGAGGGGASSSNNNHTGGGGGGGSFVYSLLPYTAAVLSVIIGEGGAGGTIGTSLPGGDATITTFRVTGVTLYTALGGIGGAGGTNSAWGVGGLSQLPLGPVDPAIDYYMGSSGARGHGPSGGEGGAAAGPTGQVSQYDDLFIPDNPGNGGAGTPDTAQGFSGSNGQCIITQYYQ